MGQKGYIPEGLSACYPMGQGDRARKGTYPRVCQPVILRPMVTGPGRIRTLKSLSAVVSACDPTAHGDRARKRV